MNYIKIFQNTQALSVSIGNSYFEYQFMYMLLGNFHQGGKHSAQTASHQVELRRQENYTDQTSLSNSSLQTEYLNLDRSLASGRNNERANIFQTKFTFFVGANHSTFFLIDKKG